MPLPSLSVRDVVKFIVRHRRRKGGLAFRDESITNIANRVAQACARGGHELLVSEEPAGNITGVVLASQRWLDGELCVQVDDIICTTPSALRALLAAGKRRWPDRALFGFKRGHRRQLRRWPTERQLAVATNRFQ